MGKALFGTHAAPSTLRLLDEVRALRQRVEELEAALAEVEALRDQTAAAEPVDRVARAEPEPAAR